MTNLGADDRFASSAAATKRIGTAGWTIPRPNASDLPGPGSHLERYSRLFAGAEINTTFYRPHRLATWQRWTTSVPDNFRFVVKAPKTITHEAALAITPETVAQLTAFLDQARQLGPKLGPILLQLPPKQAFDPDRASTFFEQLRRLHTGPVVLEPRHPTWFTAIAEDLLLAHGIARAAADPAPVPAAASPAGDPNLVYYRLHGSPRTYYSSYTDEFLEALARNLAALPSSAEAWVIFDNTASGAALGNALTLDRLLRSAAPAA